MCTDCRARMSPKKLKVQSFGYCRCPIESCAFLAWSGLVGHTNISTILVTNLNSSFCRCRTHQCLRSRRSALTSPKNRGSWRYVKQNRIWGGMGKGVQNRKYRNLTIAAAVLARQDFRTATGHAKASWLTHAHLWRVAYHTQEVH